jgi:nucleoside diphosphate kinase
MLKNSSSNLHNLFSFAQKIENKLAQQQEKDFIELDKKSPSFDRDFFKEYQKIESKIPECLSVLEKKINAVISGNKSIKTKIDIKNPSTAKEKFIRPGKTYKKIIDMPDLLRARLIVPLNLTLEKFVNIISKIFKTTKVELVNNKESGYGGAYHIDTEINGLKVELQVMYRNIVPYVDYSHVNVYEPQRIGKYVDPRVQTQVRNLLTQKKKEKEKILSNKLYKFKLNKTNMASEYVNLIFQLLKNASSLSSTENNKFKFVVLQKPLAAGKENEIESFIRNCGAKILQRKKVLIDSRLIGHHYKQFIDKPFFIHLLKYYVGKEVYVWLVEGNIKTQSKMRSLIGSPKVDINSFRHFLVGDDYKEVMKNTKVLDNGIHVSDSPEEGIREAKLWFGIPELVLDYSQDINDEVVMVHSFLWKKLNSIHWATVQYSNTNNETAVKLKPVDIDYRVLVPENKIDETVNYIIKHIPGAFLDREGVDERTGSKYKKLEFVFKSGKADIAVVNCEDYKDRIGSGHLVDLLSTNEKKDIGKRKEEAWKKGKEEYKKVKEEIQKEIKQKFNIK